LLITSEENEWQVDCTIKWTGMVVGELDWTKKEEKEALAAVCSLKRALGIADGSEKDEFQGARIKIHTADFASAELIGELLYRYGGGQRRRFYDAHPEIETLRDSVAVYPLANDCYTASIALHSPSNFAREIRKAIDKHIAPNKTFTR
jgi:hypothetical protein